MMNFLDILLLAVALAMDCFTVSIVSGIILRRFQWPVILRMSFFFGLFQSLMPFFGWLATIHFAGYAERVGHWVAFAMLAFIGGRMIWQSIHDEDEDNQHFNPTLLTTQLLLAVATSIDALAVGVSFAMTGFDGLSALVLPLCIIGVVSFVFALLGHALGIRFGFAVSRKVKPELLGGLLLIAIGLKILISNLITN